MQELALRQHIAAYEHVAARVHQIHLNNFTKPESITVIVAPGSTSPTTGLVGATATPAACNATPLAIAGRRCTSTRACPSWLSGRLMIGMRLEILKHGDRLFVR